MTKIQLVTQIAAPVERCFDLSLSIGLHIDSAGASRERAIAGVTAGLIGPGETVTWEARHFGFRQRHTSRITRYDRPRMFQDRMIRGTFAHFEHDHFFKPSGDGGTEMTDVVRFEAPMGLLGWLVDRLVLGAYLHRFLVERNAAIKRAAESDEWRQYLPERPGQPRRRSTKTQGRPTI